MRDKARLQEIIRKYYKPPFSEWLLDEIRPSIRLVPKKGKTIKLGATKFGGAPHLPKGREWYSEGGKHYSFLCQVNLTEVQPFDLEGVLPDSGILYFYSNLDEWDCGHVFYSEETENLYQPQIPEEISKEWKGFFRKWFGLKGWSKLLEECEVDMHVEYYIPDLDSLKIEKRLLEKGLSRSIKWRHVMAEKVYENDLMENEGEAKHHLLGNYMDIQAGYKELGLVATSSDIYNWSFNNPEKLPPLTTINQALEWQLLLQFDSDRDLDIQFGDGGRLFFFIKKTDLIHRNFDNVGMTADCY